MACRSSSTSSRTTSHAATSLSPRRTASRTSAHPMTPRSNGRVTITSTTSSVRISPCRHHRKATRRSAATSIRWRMASSMNRPRGGRGTGRVPRSQTSTTGSRPSRSTTVSARTAATPSTACRKKPASGPSNSTRSSGKAAMCPTAGRNSATSRATGWTRASTVSATTWRKWCRSSSGAI